MGLNRSSLWTGRDRNVSLVSVRGDMLGNASGAYHPAPGMRPVIGPSQSQYGYVSITASSRA